jgi:hypothetical protein
MVLLTINVFMESTRILPVLKTSSMMIRSSSANKHKTQENETKNDNDFSAGQVEFELSEEFDTEVVDGDDSYQEDSYEYTRVHFFSRKPVLYNQRCCSQVVRSNNDVLRGVQVSYFAFPHMT